MTTPNPMFARFDKALGKTTPTPTTGQPAVTSRADEIRNLAKQSTKIVTTQTDQNAIGNIGGKPIVSGLAGGVLKALTSSERAFGEDIAAGSTAVLPESWTGQDKLKEAQAAKEQTANDLIKKIGEERAKGGDTSKWLKLLSETTGQEIPTMADLYPAMKKSNLQVLGDAGGVLLDILSAGSYGNAIKGAESGKLLVKGGGLVENLATKVGIPTAEKAIAPVVENTVKPVLTETLKTIGKKTLGRAALGSVTGYGYDVAGNLQSGKTGTEALTPGMGTLLGGTIPLAIGGIQATAAITKETAPKFINSLIKPKQANFAYGKNPGRTVSEMGITGNSMDDFGNNINKARNEVGSQIGEVYKNPANANVAINASDEITKIDKAIVEAAKGGKGNQAVVTALQNTKDALLYEHGIDEAGNIIKIGDQAKDLSKLNPQQAFELKQLVANNTKFTGNPSDDKTVNSILQDIYGGVTEKINKAVEVNNPEIRKLNEKYGDLISAEIATKNRDMIVKRSNMVSMPVKVGTAGAIITAVTTGGAAIPVILAGAGAAALDKALESTAVKTRIASWLGSATPSMISKIPPEVKTVLYRALPKFSSQLGQE